MILENSKSAVGPDYAAVQVAAVKLSLNKEGLFAGVNYKAGTFGFFPFTWFAFWQWMRVLKEKGLKIDDSKSKGKENVIETADISQEI